MSENKNIIECPFEMGQEVENYNMVGVVVDIDEDNEKVSLYFKESNETIQFDWDEF